MIGHLTGTVTPGGDVLTASGVGYTVTTCTPLSPGDHVDLCVHTAFTQNDTRLYGFADPGQRTVFTRLLAITGVGPSAAMAILSDVGVGPLAAAVAAGDAKAVQSARGVGAKTAQRVVAELDPSVLPAAAAAVESSLPGVEAECLAALVSMGMEDDQQLRDHVTAAAAADPAADAATLLRHVLRAVMEPAA